MKKIFTLFAALTYMMSMFALTYNVTVPAGTKACYIAGEMNGWSQVEMEKVDETHYKLEVASATDAMKYKYCSGPGWAYVEKTANGDEVADRTYSANDVVEAWASVYDPGNVPTPGETKDITIKAQVPAAWTNTITAWVWPTGGEGKEVVPTKEGDWYVYTENCAELNIIFKNGAGWTGDANQTVDMTFSENTCIAITAGSGKATYTVVDCEGGVVTPPTPDPLVTLVYNVTVPAGTKACYIAGEMNGWSHTEMTKVDDTHYTISLDNVTASMEYKYCSGPNWDYVEVQENGEEAGNRKYAENDVVAKWRNVYNPTAVVTYVLMGVKGDWTTGVPMIKNEGAEFEEYQLLGQTISAGDSVKVVKLEDAQPVLWCGNVKEGCKELLLENTVNDNIILAPGVYDFYYAVPENAIWIALVSSAPSGVEDVIVEGKAVKVMRNGQMCILRDGIYYNMLGQIAE